ncbi:bucentaur or craniofacial development-domain-containing protein [Aspergillus pseudotamarii]|uniref:SWR1-complex protein 5 n=1 Tax=Aspergillus pseudotamarii TaxID=132259 RepID=A0A5N6T833_ASPPS|nr:bucentaur or craniofacial development-domain-containing protein [Aspergillus pseudotamarii]KAE8142538.1 bucentaur or craniofacial development-domain-containing protein [Aspergillus pseudotamarii]
MSADPATVPDLDLEDEQYDSADDEDFQVDAAQDDADDLTGSDSEDEPIEPATKKRKAGNKAPEQEDNNLDSGDEATIQKAKTKRAKKQKGKDEDGDDEDDVDDVDFDDEEGGPGGFVRTRAMKMRTQEERKPLAKIDGATVDVDALWEKMNAPDTTLRLNPSQTEQKNETPVEENKDTEMRDGETPVTEEKRQASQYSEEMVKIKRTYKFAGEWITEEKVVPKDSAEAKLYMANEKDVETVTAADNAADSKETIKIRRPLRKISRFDPNPTGSIKKSWEKQPIAETTQENARGPKINTVEKSRLDWAAYVDQAGIKDELKTHSKAKEGFLGRMDFLDRVGAKQEEERRNMRLKGL